MTKTEIGKKYNVTNTCIHWWMKSYGIHIKKSIDSNVNAPMLELIVDENLY